MKDELHAELIEDLARLEHAADEWDGLAMRYGRPMCAPGWMLAWWRHVAPPGALLRTVLVRDAAGALTGVAPYFAYVGRGGRTDYRLLGSGLSQRLSPVAVPGREPEVADAIAGALAAARPRPHLVTLEGASTDSPWLRLLARAMPGRLPPWSYRSSQMSAPVITRQGRSAEEWFAGRSSNFRQQMRRLRRRLEQRGGTIRLAGPDGLAEDVAKLGRLHRARWEVRGYPGVINAEVERMLCDAGRALAGTERFRLWMIEAEGTPISAQLFVAAGSQVVYWNGGFNEAWSDVKPAMLAILAAVEDAFRRGEERVDLGGGAHDYKLRFADSDDPLAWGGLAPRTARYPLTRAQLLPLQLNWAARRAVRSLPPPARERVKRALRRGVRPAPER